MTAATGMKVARAVKSVKVARVAKVGRATKVLRVVTSSRGDVSLTAAVVLPMPSKTCKKLVPEETERA